MAMMHSADAAASCPMTSERRFRIGEGGSRAEDISDGKALILIREEEAPILGRYAVRRALGRQEALLRQLSAQRNDELAAAERESAQLRQLRSTLSEMGSSESEMVRSEPSATRAVRLSRSVLSRPSTRCCSAWSTSSGGGGGGGGGGGVSCAST